MLKSGITKVTAAVAIIAIIIAAGAGIIVGQTSFQTTPTTVTTTVTESSTQINTQTATVTTTIQTSTTTPELEPKKGGDLRIGVIKQDGSTLDPLMTAQGTMLNTIWNLIFEPLVYVDENWKIVPGLATSWEIVDEFTYDFTLRQGVKFHDGTDFNAEAVKFTFERAREPAFKSMGFLIESVDVLDNYKVRFHIKSDAATPWVDFLYWMGKVPQGYMTYSPTAFNTMGAEKFGRNPAGTGPFKFVEWFDQDHITVERFDGYWGEEPYLDRVIVQVIPDSAVRALKLEKGELDMAEIDPPQVARLNRTQDVIVNFGPPAAHIVMGFNVRNGSEYLVQSNPNSHLVRQAISYAIDRQAIIDTILYGYGTPAIDRMMPGQEPYYDPALQIYPPNADPEKAKQLLAEAGYPDGIEFSIDTSGGFVDGVKTATIMIEQLAKANIKLTINDVEFGILIAHVFAPNFDSMIYDQGGMPPVSEFLVDYHSQAWPPKAFGNIPFANDTKIDASIEQLRSIWNTDKTEAKKLSDSIQKRWMEQGYHVSLYYKHLIQGMNTDVKGYVMMPTVRVEYEGAGGFIICRPATGINVWLDR